MKEYLNITQLAKLRNITSETLRHYDRIGLLKPDYVDELTGYRYYSMNQVELFDTIIDLRNLGVPLKDIAVYMRSRNVENTYTLLKDKEADLKREIAEKKKQLEHIQNKTHYLEKMGNLDFDSEARWEIVQRNTRQFVISKMYEKSLTDFLYEFTRLRANMQSEYTVFGTSISGSLILKDSFFANNEMRLSRYPAIPLELCKTKLSYGQVMELPEGSYLCCYGRGVFQAGKPIVNRIKKYLEYRGLQIVGNLYERDIIDLSLTNEESELAYCIEIPVFSC